jgi:hypothetical protein
VNPSSQRTRPDLQAEEPLDPKLVALYRAATPEQKLAAVDRLNRTLQGLKEAQMAASRPDLTAEMRRVELRRWWFSSRT